MSAPSSPPQAGNVESSERPNLISFMEEVLEQAAIFIDDTIPTTFKEGRLRKSAPAIAKVQLLRRNIPAAEIETIPWVNSGVSISEESHSESLLSFFLKEAILTQTPSRYSAKLV